MIKFSDLQNRNFVTSEHISKETKNRVSNEDAIIEANKILTFIKQYGFYVSEYALLQELIISDKEKHYYNSWKVPIYEASDITDLERMIPLYASSIGYNLIYQNVGGDLLDFYNTGEELQECSFFTIEGNILLYNVSVVISKAFSMANTEITNPQVKLELTIKPFHLVS